MHGADHGRGHGQLWQMLERIGPGTSGKMLDGMAGRDLRATQLA